VIHMKKNFLKKIVGVLSVCAVLSACQEDNAELDSLIQTKIVEDSQKISDAWHYLEDATFDLETAKRRIGWQNIDIPHTWNAFDTTDTITGYRRDGSWYKKNLQLKKDEDKRYFLHFEAAQMKASIYVNNQLAGSHIGGYVGFDIEITDQVNDGSNSIYVRVDNSIDKHLVPSQKADFFQYGGLTRDVWLHTKPNDFLHQVKITTPKVSKDSATVVIEPSTNLTSDVQIGGYRTTVYNPKGSKLFSTDDTRFSISEPQLWSPDAPNLYSIKTTMLDVNGNELDTVQETFGLRWYEFKDHGAFYLNGERLILRGTHLHEEHAGFGAAMPDSQRIADIVQIKDLGANFVRLGHYPHDPVVYDTADKLGLILMDEIPWNRGGVGGKKWRETVHYLAQRMIEQNYNRPSVFFWSLGNEMYWLPDFEGGGEASKVRDELQQLQDIAKTLDPYRLTAIRKFPQGADVVDVYSPSIWAGWYGGGYSQYEAAIKKYRSESKALLHLEYGGSSHVGRHLEKPFGPYGALGPESQSSVEEAVNQSGVTSIAKSNVWDETYIVDLFDWHLHYSENDPLFSGAAQWAFKDFGTPIRPENPLPFVNQKGLVDRSGKPKDAYHVFASYWKKEPSCWIESDTWTYRTGEPNETKNISVFCNTHSAELWLNGSSMGERKRDIQQYPASGLTWPLTFKEGSNTLQVKGYDNNGHNVANNEITVHYSTKPAGKMTDIKLTFDSNEDGTVTIFAEAQDKNGRRCLSCNERIYFTHDGGGDFIANLGTPNGSTVRELASGTASIRFQPGDSAARIGIQSQVYRGYYIEVPAK